MGIVNRIQGKESSIQKTTARAQNLSNQDKKKVKSLFKTAHEYGTQKKLKKSEKAISDQ